MWRIEFTAEFERWWRALDASAMEALAHDIDVLEAVGPGLGRPIVGSVRGSRFRNMKEIRTTHGRQVLRVLFAFDPHRSAVLLVGGDKRGDRRFYDRAIARADQLFQDHLDRLDFDGRNPDHG